MSAEKCSTTRTCTATLAEEFNEFFVSTGGKAAHASKESAETHGLHCDPPTCSRPNEISEDDLFYFHHVTTEDVTKVIMSMPSNKAPGYDKVPIRVIKDSLPKIVSTLTHLINLSFASNTFPQALKKAEVIPHPKEGDHELPNNNRPISLLPALSKVLERIALNQYLEYLTSHGRLATHQSGNRKIYSTETLSHHVTDYIFKAIDAKKVTGMGLIDLSKAFDSLSHSVLLNKLWSLGTSASALSWFESYLSDRQQTTRVGHSVSTVLTVTHGVPQGSIQGPVLFNLYLNDLPEVIEEAEIDSYVDDTKLYLSISLKDIQVGLSHISEDLKRVAEWCCSNSLLINPKKTKLILFGVPQNLHPLLDISVEFMGQQLKPVASCKDVGILLDSGLTFNEHVASLTSSLMSSLCQINRVKHLFPKNVLLLVINALIFSKLNYCSTVWSGTSKQNINKLQLVQNFAAGILTGVKTYDHVSPALKELGWLSIERLLQLRDVTMVFKCVNNLAPIYLCNKLSKRSEIHKYSTRHCGDLNLGLCRTEAAKRSFFYRAVKHFNDLTSDTRSA